MAMFLRFFEVALNLLTCLVAIKKQTIAMIYKILYVQIIQSYITVYSNVFFRLVCINMSIRNSKQNIQVSNYYINPSIMHGNILKIVYIQRIYMKIIALSCNFHYFHNIVIKKKICYQFSWFIFLNSIYQFMRVCVIYFYAT